MTQLGIPLTTISATKDQAMQILCMPSSVTTNTTNSQQTLQVMAPNTTQQDNPQPMDYQADTSQGVVAVAGGSQAAPQPMDTQEPPPLDYDVIMAEENPQPKMKKPKKR